MRRQAENQAAAQALRRIRELKLRTEDSGTDKEVIGFLESPHAPVIEEAARLAGDRELSAAVAPLIQAYGRLDGEGRDRGCHARKAIAYALGRLGHPSGESVLLRALRTVQIETVGFGREDTALDLRATAVLSLVQVSPRRALHEAALLLFDATPPPERALGGDPFARARTRAAAAQALAALGSETGAALLAVKLIRRDHEVSEVLAECLEAFASLHPPGLEEIARAYLADPDPYLAVSAVTSLARHLGADAIEWIVEAYPQTPDAAREPFVLAVTGIRSERTGRVLLQFLDDPIPQVRIAAVKGAALYMDETVRSRLTRAAGSDPNPAVREAALAAISQTG